MTIFDTFAPYHIGAWLFGDGVTSRHIPRVESSAHKGKRLGMIAAATAITLSAVAMSVMPSTSFNGLAIQELLISKTKLSPQSDEPNKFAVSTAHLMSNYSVGLKLDVSADTLALAKRAVAQKTDFTPDSVESWASNLLRIAS